MARGVWNIPAALFPPRTIFTPILRSNSSSVFQVTLLHPAYRAFYDPSITTSSLYLLGREDTVVGLDAPMRLVSSFDPSDRESKTQVVWHPGCHFVPDGEGELDSAARFIMASVG